MATAKKATAPVAPDTSAKAPAKAPSKAPVKAPVKTPVKTKAAKPAPKKASAGKALVKKPGAKKPAAKPQTVAKTEKLAKPKKPKLVRDSFTIPKAEYVVLDELKQRAAKLTRPAKKSELLRAGIKLLASLSNAAFLTALEQVPAIKTGRPTLGT